jgi:hypothetical protein
MFLMLLLIGVDGQMFTALRDFVFIKYMLEIVKEKDVSQLFLACWLLAGMLL